MSLKEYKKIKEDTDLRKKIEQTLNKINDKGFSSYKEDANLSNISIRDRNT